jgi:hypothetical protein
MQLDKSNFDTSQQKRFKVKVDETISTKLGLYCYHINYKLRGFSPRANYSDRRLSAKLVSILRIEGATWSAWRIPTAVFSDF